MRLLQPLLLLLLTPLAARADDALARPLAALLGEPLAAPALDEQLQLAFERCRASGGSFSDTEDAGGQADGRADAEADARRCGKVKFVRLQRLRFQAIRAALRGERAPAPESAVPVLAASEVAFEDFFQQFEQPERPVVLRHGEASKDGAHPVVGLAKEELAKLHGDCVASGETGALRVDNAACAELLDTSGFRVPNFLTHNYLVRTDMGLESPSLPVAYRLTAATPSIVACPHGLHSLIVSMAATPVEFALYSSKFQPLSRDHEEWKEMAVDADSSLSWRSAGDNTGPPASVLDSNYLHLAPQLAQPGSVLARDVLFVPGNAFATMKLAQETSGASSALTLRFCLCDASNWNSVKREAAIAALAADHERGSARRLLRALQSPSLDTVIPRRPADDDAYWQQYFKWPRNQKFVRKSDLMTNSALSDEQIHLQLSRRERLKQWQEDRRWDRMIASMTLPVARAPLVVNASRSSVILKWQELLEPPRVDTELTNVGYELRWTVISTDYEPHSSDSIAEPAPLAMNVTHSRLKRSRRRSALFGDDFDGRDLEFAVPGLDPETTYTFTVRLFVGDDLGGESPPSRAVRTGPCAPPSRPRGVPVVSVKNSDNPSCVSLRWIDPRDDGGKRIEKYLVAAMPFITDRDTSSMASACLLPPGGAASDDPERVSPSERIVALDAASVESGSLRVNGVPWKSARVCALLPAPGYQFRVAARNALGVGDWSLPSTCTALSTAESGPPPLASPLSQPLASSLRLSSSRWLSASSRSLPPFELQDEGVPTLRGRGDALYEAASDITRGDLVDAIGGRQYPHALLSDVEQTLVVLGNGTGGNSLAVLDELELWSGHFSPRSFRVSAQLVRADPLDASRPLRNAAEVRDRVAVVARGGGVPLAVKAHFAQLAGAVGVVIVDVGDACGGRFDQRCVPGADRGRREGFAALDRHALWARNRIPTTLALRDGGARLLELLR